MYIKSVEPEDIFNDLEIPKAECIRVEIEGGFLVTSVKRSQEKCVVDKVLFSPKVGSRDPLFGIVPCQKGGEMLVMISEVLENAREEASVSESDEEEGFVERNESFPSHLSQTGNEVVVKAAFRVNPKLEGIIPDWL